MLYAILGLSDRILRDETPSSRDNLPPKPMRGEMVGLNGCGLGHNSTNQPTERPSSFSRTKTPRDQVVSRFDRLPVIKESLSCDKELAFTVAVQIALKHMLWH